MGNYHYRGQRYTHKPTLKTKVKAKVRDIASRVWESIQGGHPGMGEAEMARIEKEYPSQPQSDKKGE